MKKLVALLWFITLLGVSCQKDDFKIENPGIPLLTSEMYGEDLGWIYTYNERNLPDEVKSKWSYQKFHYSDNNLLIGYDLYFDPGIYSSDSETVDASMNRIEWVSPLNTKRSAYAHYDYEKGKITQIKVFNDNINSSHLNISEFTYNKEGLIVRSSNDGSYKEYDYDDKGNLIESRHYFDNTLIARHQFTFDDHPNPFKVLKKTSLPGRNMNENNIIKEIQTVYDDNGAVTYYWEEESAYVYNDKGYPVKKNDMVIYTYK